MKLRQVTLKMPSPALKEARVNSSTHDLVWGDSFVMAVPLIGKGPTLVWSLSNIAEAILMPEVAEKPQEKPALAIVPKPDKKKVSK